MGSPIVGEGIHPPLPWGRLRSPLCGGHPPPFSFRLAEKKSAVDGGKEKGAVPDGQGQS